MTTLRLILGDQLNHNHSWFQNPQKGVHYLMMETLETETPDNLIRVSVGIEAVEDLLQDLERMLQA